MYTFGVSSTRFHVEESDHLVRLRRRETDTRLWLRGLGFAGFAAAAGTCLLRDPALGAIVFMASSALLLLSGALLREILGARRSTYRQLTRSLEIRREPPGAGGYRDAPAPTTIKVDGNSFGESELLGVVVAVSELVLTDNRGQVTTVRSYMPTVVFDKVAYELERFEGGDESYAHTLADAIASAAANRTVRAPNVELHQTGYPSPIDRVGLIAVDLVARTALWVSGALVFAKLFSKEHGWSPYTAFLFAGLLCCEVLLTRFVARKQGAYRSQAGRLLTERARQLGPPALSPEKAAAAPPPQRKRASSSRRAQTTDAAPIGESATAGAPTAGAREADSSSGAPGQLPAVRSALGIRNAIVLLALLAFVLQFAAHALKRHNDAENRRISEGLAQNTSGSSGSCYLACAAIASGSRADDSRCEDQCRLAKQQMPDIDYAATYKRCRSVCDGWIARSKLLSSKAKARRDASTTSDEEPGATPDLSEIAAGADRCADACVDRLARGEDLASSPWNVAGDGR
jgi:hypothetical protein